MKNFISSISIFRLVSKLIYFIAIEPLKRFPGSENYWKKRYLSRGTSGAGSYGKLATFKADVLNYFVRENNVNSIIEYGCGDGNQLKLANYPHYIGFDISENAISRCNEAFSKDDRKSFFLTKEYAEQTADLTLSIDVIFHLIEDDVFFDYMSRLFDSSNKYVIIYSSNTEKQSLLQAKHVRHREFARWVSENRPQWKLTERISNKYPKKSFSDFYIYSKGESGMNNYSCDT